MKNKKIGNIFDFLEIAENLKVTERWLSVKGLKKRESSADHSWKMSLMTMIFTSEFDFGVDETKVLKMSIIHDLVEAITGDIDYCLVCSGAVLKEDKIKNEKKAINKIRKKLPTKIGKEIYNLWNEFENAETKEARFSKALDRLETMSHYLSFSLDGKNKEENWNPDLQATYCDKALSEFPKLLPFLRELKQRLKKKYKQAGIKWLKKYDVV
jgi:putative hydrolase of HD superfamily